MVLASEGEAQVSGSQSTGRPERWSGREPHRNPASAHCDPGGRRQDKGLGPPNPSRDGRSSGGRIRGRPSLADAQPTPTTDRRFGCATLSGRPRADRATGVGRRTLSAGPVMYQCGWKLRRWMNRAYWALGIVVLRKPPPAPAIGSGKPKTSPGRWCLPPFRRARRVRRSRCRDRASPCGDGSAPWSRRSSGFPTANEFH